MYIKNALRLALNNLNISFKAMLFCLISTIIFIFLFYGILYAGLSVLFKSAQFQELISDLKDSVLRFFGVQTNPSNSLSVNFNAFILLVKQNMLRIVLTCIALFFVLFGYNFALGLCNFAMAVMIDRYMSEISKCHFVQTFLECLGKALLFELFLSGLKTLFYLIVTAAALLLLFFLSKIFSVVALLLVAWLYIAAVAIFYTFTSNLRPLVVRGATIRDAFKEFNVYKRNVAAIFASYVFSIVLVVYINVTMCIATLGAGLIVSVPLSFLFMVCLQQVINYNLYGRKYYVDFDNIVIPKQLRGEDEQLLNEVDI